MSETRLTPVICRCSSARCNQQRFRDKDGNWQPGAIVSVTTRVNHLAVDTQIAARFCGVQHSNDDNDESNSVSEIEINRLALSSQPLDVDRSNALNRSSVYDCGPYHRLSLRHSEPAVLYMSLMTAQISVFGHTSSKTSTWLMKSGKGLVTLTASGGLGESKYKPLNLRQENTLDTLPYDIRTIVKWFKLDPKLVKVVCCRSCFAMYPMQPKPTADKNDQNAVQHVAPKVPKGPLHCINMVFPNEADADAKALLEAASPCETDLY
ncbi:hypothetical protein PtA15_3A313 [Puccinia triticina]|uniref:Uncharacterized protein n=1 Tax=Puccinia triticina TaxID=208348 RepID=A0ABY7CJH0_9BASI|nr:uncharacterized protein PtA15_3A313 [Puccinia triticina]WAQ82947.1 hypothetical protein PtA15_3A313 [Puccinia triticina]WAR53774.1 hypothetical protein PtB15_3B283 [Puccinia triticina]